MKNSSEESTSLDRLCVVSRVARLTRFFSRGSETGGVEESPGDETIEQAAFEVQEEEQPAILRFPGVG
jgi:hypothetical protein